jgi:hypothetical protein
MKGTKERTSDHSSTSRGKGSGEASRAAKVLKSGRQFTVREPSTRDVPNPVKVPHLERALKERQE